MSESVVYDLLLTRVGEAELALGLPVSYPDVEFAPPARDLGDGVTEPLPYAVADVITSTSDLSGAAYDSDVTSRGLLTLNVVHPAGQGLIKPVGLADRLITFFRPGTTLTRDGVDVRVHEAPTRAGNRQEGGAVTVPIIVRWVASVPR